MLEVWIEPTLSGGGWGVGKALELQIKRGSKEENWTGTDLSRSKTYIHRPKTTGNPG